MRQREEKARERCGRKRTIERDRAETWERSRDETETWRDRDRMRESERDIQGEWEREST